MKNKRIHFMVATVALFCVVATVSAQDQAPAPTFKEGDTWQFNISRKTEGGGSVYDWTT